MSGGAQNKGKNFVKIPCHFCDELISTTQMTRHQKTCKKKPLHLKTFGELTPEEFEKITQRDFIPKWTPTASE
jgi:hypothetical protein